MKLNNEQGFIHHCIAAAAVSHTVIVAVIFQSLFGLITAAAVWHIPAWEKAKANNSTGVYQSSEQWPQQLFDQLPGGTPGRSLPTSQLGNGGNFEGGMSK